MKNRDSILLSWKQSELDPYEIFPWEDVLKSKIISDKNNLSKHCPRCDEERDVIGKNFANNDELITVLFRSPDRTWKELCGREGYLTICTKHKRQVDFHCTVMN